MTLQLPTGWDTDPTVASETLAVLRAAANRKNPPPTFDSPGELARALDPTTVQTPALDLIDDALQRVQRGETTRLIISMPPQEGKSERTTHYGALWMLHKNPNLRLAIVSYGDRIAQRFSYKIRRDISTYTGVSGSIDLNLTLARDSKAASDWKLQFPFQGSMYAIGIGGGLTSMPVDALFIDDPVKDFRAADSELQSEQAWEWWQTVARPRLAPGAPVVIILTRWSELDLAGRLLSKQADDEKNGLEDYDRWEVINISAQAEFDPDKGETDILGREPGEFMISARGRTEAMWRATKAATAARGWNALYQGKPSPDAGDVWMRNWWRRYEVPLWSMGTNGSWLIECDELIQSWDFTFKDSASSDYVVGGVLARRDADVYLVDMVRERMSFNDSITAMKAMHKKWPQARTILVEDKANGPAIINSLKSEIPGIIAVEPDGSKYARASAVSPFIESGNVKLPTAGIVLFDVDGLIEEAAAFPNGAHDDQVDMLSQALARMFISGAGAAVWLQQIQEKIATELAARRQVEEAEQAEITDAQTDAERMAAIRNQAFRNQLR